MFFWARTHPLFRSWVRIGIGPTHFLRWIVYYCVSIQHDVAKSQISFIELCKTLRTNSGLRAINSCLHLFWPQLCKACWVNIVLWQQNLKLSFHRQTVSLDPPTCLHRSTPLYTHALLCYKSTVQTLRQSRQLRKLRTQSLKNSSVSATDFSKHEQ